jgi:hypothetical protein
VAPSFFLDIMMPAPFRKFVSTTLIAIFMAQPALAGSEYRIPLRDMRPTANTNDGVTPSNGAGNGQGMVDVGSNPMPSKLKFNPATLSFNADSGTTATPTTKSSVLTNEGLGPADLSAIASNSDFTVTHDCPAELAPAATCAVKVRPTVSAPPGASYALTVVSSTAAAPATLQLTVSATAPKVLVPQLSLSEEIVNVGSKLNPGESAAGSSVLSNVGKAVANLTGIVAGGDGFTVSSDCPATLAIGQSCNISAVFSSEIPGAHHLTLPLKGTPEEDPTPLTFTAGVIGDPAHEPALAFDTDMLMFDVVALGTTATKTAVLSNKGTVPATLGQLVSSPDFKITNDCPDTLAVNASCNVTVVFAALAQGTAPAYKLVAHAQDDVTAELGMSARVPGTNGTSAADYVTLEPKKVEFGNVAVGESATQAVAVTNTGADAVGVSSMKFGEGGASFAQTNDCGDAIAAGATCSISLSFAPKAPAAPSGSLTVTFVDKSQQSLGVSGQGIAAILSAGSSSISLGSILRPGASKVTNVGIGNAGNIPLTGVAIVNNDARMQFNYGNCTDAVAPKKGCTFSFIYTPDADGPFSTSFQLTTENGGSSTYTVTGMGVRVSMSPSSIGFTDTQIGTSSEISTVTFSNDGEVNVPLDGVSVITGFQQFGQSNNCGKSLAAGSTCSVSVRFTPQKVGSYTGVLGATSNGVLVGNVALSGTAIDYRLGYSSKVVSFGAKPVGQPATPMSVIVTNPAPDTTEITSLKVLTGGTDYQQTNNCGTSLASGASCTITVQFTPTAQNSRTGSMEVVSSRGTATIPLIGEGAKPAQAKPAISMGGQTATPSSTSDGFTHYAITFLDTEVNMSSAIRNIAFTNMGDGPLAVQGIMVIDGPDDFKQSNNCGAVLAPQQSCTISLVFTPTALGDRTGGMALMSDNGNFYFDMTGKGTGATAKWTATSVDFGTTSVGSTVTRGMTLHNTGTVPAKNISVTLAGSDVTLSSNSCGTPSAPVTLNAGTDCTVYVKYAPTAVGNMADVSVTATGRLANGSQVLALKGGAISSSLVIIPPAAGTDFGNSLIGAKPSRMFTIKNVSSVSDSLSAMPWVEGEGYAVASSNNCTSRYSLPPGYNCTVTVVATSATPGEFKGVLYATSTKGGSAQVDLTAAFHKSTVEVSRVSNASSPPVTDFGTVSAGAGKVLRYFYLRDSNKETGVTANSVSLTGDSAFTVNAVEIVGSGYADSTTNMYNCSGVTASGTSTPCAAGVYDRVIRIVVAYTPTEAGPASANLHIEHNGASGFADVPLTGTGAFDSTALWSTSYMATVTPTDGDLSFGTLLKSASAVSKYVYLRNAGTYGRQSVGFMVSGDTANFTVRAINMTQSSSGSQGYACLSSSGKVATDFLSTTPCLTSDIAGMAPVSNGWTNIRITVYFQPKAVGSYSATITPYTDNGTILPGAITVTGGGK